MCVFFALQPDALPGNLQLFVRYIVCLIFNQVCHRTSIKSLSITFPWVWLNSFLMLIGWPDCLKSIWSFCWSVFYLSVSLSCIYTVVHAYKRPSYETCLVRPLSLGIVLWKIMHLNMTPNSTREEETASTAFTMQRPLYSVSVLISELLFLWSSFSPITPNSWIIRPQYPEGWK